MASSGLKIEEAEEEDDDSDKDNDKDAAASDEIRLGDELADGPSMALGASPLPKSPKPPTPAKRRAVDAFGLLDGDFQREVSWTCCCIIFLTAILRLLVG